MSQLVPPANRILSRRAFAHFALATLALASGIPTALAKSGKSHITGQVLSEIFSDMSAARAIGNAYLNSAAYRQNTVDPITPLMNSNYSHGRAEICDALRRQIQSDFASDRIVTVNGWVLSKTEVDLCALAVIS